MDCASLRGHGIVERETAAIRRKLLAWFRREKRQLPWRGTRDPYRIWLSEVMLQQTTVGAVRERYAPFLARFPTIEDLARAREESVLAAWSGLGYYARARHLHRAARRIVRKHGGRLPRDPATLRALPGCGEYIAAAVASLAFDAPLPAAEANVTRVLSRVFAIEGVAGTPAHSQAVRRFAGRLLSRHRPGDVTAALMDLGQLICAPRSPKCPSCPLASDCTARRQGTVAAYPRRRPRPSISRIHVAAACASRGGRVLLVRSTGALLQGLWQFPSAEGETAPAALRRLRRVMRGLGWRVDERGAPRVTQHTIVHRRLAILVYPAVPGADSVLGIGRRPATLRWFSPAALSRAAIPTLTHKIAAASGFPSAARRRILERDASRDAARAAHGDGRPADPHPRADAVEGRNRLPAQGGATAQEWPLRLHDPRRENVFARRKGSRRDPSASPDSPSASRTQSA